MKADNFTWNDYAKRVIIISADYLNFDGTASAGGRQRFIRDIVNIIKKWGREVVVIQKASLSFNRVCNYGVNVIGIKSDLSSKGDFMFSYKAHKFETPGDVFLYASGEDQYPFFKPSSKAIQHGVWWDGPQKRITQLIQRHRALSMLSSVKSVLCVDTNFINWARCQGRGAYFNSIKCQYIPNYADERMVGLTKREPASPLLIFAARRNEEKRGLHILIDALQVLKQRGVDFRAHISTNQGKEDLFSYAITRGVDGNISISYDSFEDVLDRYKNFHVAVIPTLWSEGTSLSCVEAIVAGLPVVTTNVGGLGNLVIPAFNGYICQATSEAFADALEKLSDFDNWKSMNLNCLSMSSSLNKSRWDSEVFSWLNG